MRTHLRASRYGGPVPSRHASLVVAFSIALTAAVDGAQPPSSLTREETARWLEVGQRCEAPIVRLPGRGGDFEIYIESPAGRAAVVAATATMMHQGLDTAAVRTALRDGYRVWVAYSPSSSSYLTIDRITIRGRGSEVLQPADVVREHLAVGKAPSHGIIEPIRWRYQEFVFPSLPPGDFDVILRTSAGVQRYHVNDRDRSRLIRVCNG